MDLYVDLFDDVKSLEIAKIQGYLIIGVELVIIESHKVRRTDM